MNQGGLRQIFTEAFIGNATNQVEFNLPPGDYEGLLFRTQGTSEAAQSFDPEDLGELDINDGSPLTRVQFSVLDDLAQMKGGIFERTAPVAGVTNFYVPYFFNWFGDEGTIFKVADNETVRVRLLFDTALMTTDFAGTTVTITVYAISKTGIMPYRLMYNRFDADIINGRQEHVLKPQNIVAVYVENNTNMAEIVYTQDGETLIDVVRDALISLTHLDNKLETFVAATPILELNFDRNHDISDIKNSSNVINLRGIATDTVTLTIVSIFHTPNELVQTLAIKNQEKQVAANRKIAAGQPESVQVDEIFSEAQ